MVTPKANPVSFEKKYYKTSLAVPKLTVPFTILVPRVG